MKCEVPECDNDATDEQAGGWTICSSCIERYYLDRERVPR